jgi:D-glycero-alpha-D-manno-heptose 1-phosphate guanylyltransferase
MSLTAIVLAGGLGTRLRSTVPDLPKPMAPINGRPFLALLLEYLSEQGVDDLILSVGYKHEVIQDYFGAGNSSQRVRYSVEDNPLGTGGAIRKALELVQCDPVFVVNADTFVRLDYRTMWSMHQAQALSLYMAVARVEDTARYGRVAVRDGRVVEFGEKGIGGPGLINAGVYLVSRELFTGCDLPERFSLEQDFLYPAVAELRPGAFEAGNYFIDIGVPEDYYRAQIELAG